MLEVAGIGKDYRVDGGVFTAVDSLSFHVAEGELVCVVGPSGCGKTTLLRMCAGLLAPTRGTARVDGRDVDGPPEGTAVVFQEYGRSLFPWMRVGANVELPLKRLGLTRAERRDRVAEALRLVDLEGKEQVWPWQLSGGMQQRVAIARAVAFRPRLLLMDEPFAAVDAQTRADLEDLIRDLWSRLGITVVFITHDIDESVYLGQRVLVLSSPPTTLRAEIHIDLGPDRDQLDTRSAPAFAKLRAAVWREIQAAKRGAA
ncbi:NitT/TauT family transport system ATP-binding protein [Glycomyces sambucus]|uniref:NitT/TauT family transport system ATP-binding protein n=1 Tax=Glycomyces sambucus TaxID=380244 RepID=A0A1G9KW92_9ACTN|nr:ABC transporter ATP-binding protein [Glycomyces sambucus]SDL53971.1 NitT/TauT family transport system ATP-binding protein [Glycomyces sambucus]